MRFTPGYWVHERFMDVAIEIVKVQYQDSRKAKLKIIWWNRGWTGNPWRIFPNPEKLEIKAKDFSGWHKLSTLERHASVIK